MRKLLLALLIIGIFIFENVFVILFSGNLFGGNLVIVPRFLFLAITFLAVFVNDKYGVSYGIAFGILYDIVYTEVLGIYLFLFPVLIYVTAQLMKFLYKNIVVTSIVAIIATCVLEIVVYEVNFLLRFTQFSFSYFAENRLAPTIILNLIFLLIFSYPLKKYFEKLSIQLKNE